MYYKVIVAYQLTLDGDRIPIYAREEVKPDVPQEDKPLEGQMCLFSEEEWESLHAGS